MAQVNPIPEGMHTLTPNLVLRDCAKAIEFYKQALGAREVIRMAAPDGKTVWHAELQIGDSRFFMNDEMPGMTQAAPSLEVPSQVTLWLYVEDCDAAFQRAIAAGGQEAMAPEDMFWGDRCASINDPFGYCWSFATHMRDVTDEEVYQAAQAHARSEQEQPGA